MHRWHLVCLQPVDREATSAARLRCAFREIAVFKGRRNRRISHRLGAPNLARAIGGMHWPCKGTPLRGVDATHPGKDAQPRRCRHQLTDTHEYTETHTHTRNTHTHEYTPHCIAVSSTSAGSSPSRRGRIPISRFACPCDLGRPVVHASTWRPRSHVVDGNEGEIACSRRKRAPPFRSLLCRPIRRTVLSKSVYDSPDRCTLPSHDRDRVRQPASRRCRRCRR